jgi:hypothetical protein
MYRIRNMRDGGLPWMPYASPITDEEAEKRKAMSEAEWNNYHCLPKSKPAYLRGEEVWSYRQARAFEAELCAMLKEGMTSIQLAHYFPDVSERTVRNRLNSMKSKGLVKTFKKKIGRKTKNIWRVIE